MTHSKTAEATSGRDDAWRTPSDRGEVGWLFRTFLVVLTAPPALVLLPSPQKGADTSSGCGEGGYSQEESPFA